MGVPRESRARIPLAVASAAGLGLAAPAVAHGADFTVTNLNDDGPGSLREAIDSANATPAPDRVLFKSGLSGNIDLTSGGIYSYEPVEIDGPGGDAIRVRELGGSDPVMAFVTDPGENVSIDGLGFRAGSGVFGGNLLFVDADVTLSDVSSLRGKALGGAGLASYGGDLAITDSRISGNESYAFAGGVYACSSGSITLENTEINDNKASYAGAGALCADGSTSISESMVSGNEAPSGAPGLFMYADSGVTVADSTVSDNVSQGGCYCAGYGGGLFTADSKMTITGSTISGNRGGLGAGIGSIYGRLIVRDSTVSGNHANGYGVAAGIYAYDSVLTITNSTIAGNKADALGGGIVVGEGADGDGGPVTLRGTTVTANDAPAAAGVLSELSEDVSVDSAIVAGNSASEDLDGAFAGDFNVVGGVSGSLSGQGNQLNVANPRLGPLTDNGGPTETVLPAQSSPAIDAGDPALDGSRDQRGIVRDVTDAGSVEAALCMGVPVNRIGTDGDDDLEGTNAADGILGFAGDDTISGLNGADGICAGQGDDDVNAGNGADGVLGNRGDDTINGKNGPDDINAGGGKDDVSGGAATDEIQGGNGADDLGGGAGNGDRVFGGNGGDLLAGGSGIDDLCNGQRGRNRAKPNCDIVRNARPVGGAAADAGSAVEQGLDEAANSDTQTDATEETDPSADALELGEPEAVRPGGAAAE